MGNAFETLRPMYYASKALALAPYALPTRPPSAASRAIDALTWTYSSLVWTTYAYGFATSIGDVVADVDLFSTSSFVMGVGEDVAICAHYAYYAQLVCFVVRERRRIVAVLDAVDACAAEIELCGATPRARLPADAKVTLVNAWAATTAVLFLFLEYRVGVLADRFVRFDASQYLMVFVQTPSIVVFAAFVHVVLLSVERNLARLNDIVEAEAATATSDARTARLCAMYANNWRAVELINACFGAYWAYYWVSSVIVATVFSYYVVHQIGTVGVSDAFLMAYMATWALSVVVGMLVGVATCECVYREARRTPALLHSLWSRQSVLDPSAPIKSLQLFHQRIAFTAHGLFTIDFKIVFEVFGGIVTFLVVMVQFDEMKTVQK